MRKYINIYLEVAKEVEYLMLRENLEFNAALRKAKETYNLKEVHDPTDQDKDHEPKLYNEILTLKRNIGK